VRLDPDFKKQCKEVAVFMVVLLVMVLTLLVFGCSSTTEPQVPTWECERMFVADSFVVSPDTMWTYEIRRCVR
jgi:hypothetical protein